MEFRFGSVAELISGMKSPQKNIGIKFESVQTPKEKTPTWKSNKNFSQKANKQMGSNVNVQSLQISPKVITPQRKHDNFSPRYKPMGNNVNVQSENNVEYVSATPKRKHNKNISPSYKQMGINDVQSEDNLKRSHNVECVSAKHKRKRDKKFSPTNKQMGNNVNVQSENKRNEEYISATHKKKHNKMFSPTNKQMENNAHVQSENNAEYVSVTPTRKHDKKISPTYKQMGNNGNIQSASKLKRSHNEEQVSAKKNKRRKLSNINDDSDGDTKTKNQRVEDEENDLEKKNESREQENKHTIFVGNVPLNVKASKIAKFFKPYGEVESVRLRCAPVADPRIPPKVAIIKKEFHAERTSIAAFVRFKCVDSTYKALEKNGAVFQGHHIRVDLASNKNRISHDPRYSIFLGNLPYGIEDEELWNMFASCGQIQSVRIIRDPKTRVGKGIGYINFQSPDAVELALNLDGMNCRNRFIRVKRSKALKLEKEKSERRKNKNKDNVNKYSVNEDNESGEKSETMQEDGNIEIEERDNDDYEEEKEVAEDDGVNVSYSKPERRKTNFGSKNSSFQGRKVPKDKKSKKGRKNKSDRIKKVAINKIAPRSSPGFKKHGFKKDKSDRIKKTAINKIAPRSSPEFKKRRQSDQTLRFVGENRAKKGRT